MKRTLVPPAGKQMQHAILRKHCCGHTHVRTHHAVFHADMKPSQLRSELQHNTILKFNTMLWAHA